MIAVTFALPAESSQFVRLLRNRSRESRDGSVRFVGERHGEVVVVLHTGVGEKIAQKRMRSFFAERPHLRLIISAGFAGALDPVLRVGDLLVAENFSDPKLFAMARRQLRDLPARAGTLASSGRVLDSSDERRLFAEKTSAIAVDMETESVAEECRRAGVRLLSLRAVTDTPRRPFPAPAEVLFDIDAQRTVASRLAAHLVTHPLAVPKLILFSRRVAHARRTLTHALDLLLRAPLA